MVREVVFHKNAPFPITRWFLGEVYSYGRDVLSMTGHLTTNTLALIRFVVGGQIGFKRLTQQVSFVGMDSLGIALTLAIFSGMVIALQIAKEMVKQGAGNYIGSLVALAMLRELAPIMTAIAVISMAGSAFAAELSTMRITQQVDALRVLHVHPIRYLILPRVLAAILSLPMMTIITGTAGILGGLFVTTAITDVHPDTFMDAVFQQTDFRDITSTMTKSVVFGYLIAMLSCTIGINTSGGSKEVGQATTRSVVWSFLAVAIFDYILTYLFYGSK